MSTNGLRFQLVMTPIHLVTKSIGRANKVLIQSKTSELIPSVSHANKRLTPLSVNRNDFKGAVILLNQFYFIVEFNVLSIEYLMNRYLKFICIEKQCSIS